MRRRAFIFLMWGFLFVLLNFRIQNVNLLPTFVGYILCSIALRELRQKNPFFRRGFVVGIVLLVLSLPKLFHLGNSNVTITNINGLSSMQPFVTASFGPALMMMVIGVALQLLYIYWIFQGIKEMALKIPHYELRDAVNQPWQMYVASAGYNVIAARSRYGIGAWPLGRLRSVPAPSRRLVPARDLRRPSAPWSRDRDLCHGRHTHAL